jgi:hypothetical protein
MSIVVLRSICVGIAAAIGAIVLAGFALIAASIYWIAHNSPPAPPGVEVGYDVVTIVRNLGISGTTVFFFAIVVFFVGCLAAFRHFSRSVQTR